MLSISKNNSKVPFSMVNLAPIASCDPLAPCKRQCYAMKAYRMYPNVRKAQDGNLELWQTDPEAFESELCAYLEKYRKPFFRWHSAGDVPDMAYLHMMERVAERFPSIHFLAFTKRFFALRVKPLDNLTVRFSEWGKYWFATYSTKAVYVPKGETAPANAMVCPGSCKTCQACWDKNVKLVAFHHH